MKQLFLLVLTFMVCQDPLPAQANLQPSPVLQDAIGKIKLLEGQWNGSGWIRMGPQQHSFNQTESVTAHANGTVLCIDGLGHDVENPDQVIHQAFAVISYDQQAGKYLMRAVRADGNHVDADFQVKDDGSITWGFTHPMAGQIRYTIHCDGQKWREDGEMSRDGQQWMPFFSMSLEKE